MDPEIRKGAARDLRDLCHLESLIIDRMSSLLLQRKILYVFSQLNITTGLW